MNASLIPRAVIALALAALASSSVLAADLVYAETSGTRTTIWQASADDVAQRQELLRLEHVEGWDPAMALSPDGRRVAIIAVTSGSPARIGGTTVLVGDFASGTLRTVDAGANAYAAPVWIDGDAFVYEKTGAPETQVLRASASGAAPSVIATSTAAALLPLGRSGDGVEGIVWYVAGGGTSRLASIAPESKSFRDLADLGAEVPSAPRLSPDGRSVAFVEAARRREIVTVDVATGEARRETLGTAATNVVWSADSKRLLVGVGDENAVAPASDVDVVAPRASVMLLDRPLAAFPLSESADGRYRALRYQTAGENQFAVRSASGEQRIASTGWIEVLGWKR